MPCHNISRIWAVKEAGVSENGHDAKTARTVGIYVAGLVPCESRLEQEHHMLL